MTQMPAGYGRALAMAHVSVLFMGSAGVVAAASGFHPWRTTSYRVVFGAVVLLAVMALMRRNWSWPSAKRAGLYLALGVLLAVHWFAFFKSIVLLDVMLGSALIGLEPLMIAAGAYFFLGEKLNLRTKLAFAFSMIGFVILGSGGSFGEPEIILGLAWAVFSYILFSVLVLANRKLAQHDSPIMITALQMIGAIPITVLMTPGAWLPEAPIDWGYAIVLGVLCTGLAYGFYNTSMKVLDAATVGIMLSLEVVYGILGGWLIGDRLSTHEALAAVFISSILWLDLWAFFKMRMTRRSLPRGQAQEAQVHD